MILSQFIQAPLVAFGICAPLLISSVEVLGISRSKVIFPLGIVAVCTCCTLPFGAGATVAAELNGYMESYGYTTYQVGLTDPALARLPVLIISILYVTFIAMKLAPEKCLVPSTFEKVDAKKTASLKPYQEIAGVIIFFGTSVALMFGKQLGLATWVITCLGGLLVVLFGILKKKRSSGCHGDQHGAGYCRFAFSRWGLILHWSGRDDRGICEPVCSSGRRKQIYCRLYFLHFPVYFNAVYAEPRYYADLPSHCDRNGSQPGSGSPGADDSGTGSLSDRIYDTHGQRNRTLYHGIRGIYTKKSFEAGGFRLR